MTHCFTVAMMVSLLGKCCPHSPSFISLKTWKSEGAKSRLHSGCGRTVQSMCQCAPHSSKRYGARYYHVAKEKLSSSVDWLWKLEHSAEWASQWSSQSWGLSALQGIQKDHLLSYPKTQCMSLYHLRAVSRTSLSTGIDMLPLHGLPFSLQLVVMTPCLVISNDIIQKTVTFSLILVQYNRTNLRTAPPGGAPDCGGAGSCAHSPVREQCGYKCCQQSKWRWCFTEVQLFVVSVSLSLTTFDRPFSWLHSCIFSYFTSPISQSCTRSW